MTALTDPTPVLRVRPADLTGHPAVEQLLDRLGLGTFVGHDLTARPGRNENWAGTTTSGTAVFVKQLSQDPLESVGRIRRAISFEQLLAGSAPGPLRAPSCLGWADGLMVFRLVDAGRTGLELALGEEFDERRAAEVGAAIAHLHSLAPVVDLDETAPPFPPFHWLDGLPWAVYGTASAGLLELWRTIHADPQLRADLRAVAVRDAAAPRVPAHCDLRLDQLLYDSDTLLISDWEDFRRADPARDVGAFAGEWLYRAVLALPAFRDQEAAADGAGPAGLIAHGVAELARVRPVVHAFWGAYVAGRQPDPELTTRATALAGWHLFDRLMAAAPDSPRLSATQRAAAGIGRLLLHRPADAAALIGLGGR
ncbi:class V lanthionine synthetase subunit LxmK [uncultured Modestobacter sp.]|uniref:class V lanthionine synthetase subunit LxmK n=1 Tax=uncultured Modestobacter sp. TaxID=380048 RepID=UPI0026243D87|nr:class V lanthionine synthetase subunit LxmK [uncultured Modestobacter sp.]